MEMPVPYLGQRNYVQGTTLFNEFAVVFSDGRNISFKITRPLLHNVVEAQSDAEDFPCTVRWVNEDGPQLLGIRETDQSQPHLRVAYQEEELTDGATFTDTTVAHTLRGDFLEAAVALYKALLHRIAPPAPGEQYLFTRVDLDRMPKGRDLRLVHLGQIARVHFGADIHVDGERLGKLYFSRQARIQTSHPAPSAS